MEQIAKLPTIHSKKKENVELGKDWQCGDSLRMLINIQVLRRSARKNTGSSSKLYKHESALISSVAESDGIIDMSALFNETKS